MGQTKECVKRIRPYVDRAVIIVDEFVSEDSKEWLRSQGCEVYLYPWEDSMVKMRNHYLEKLSPFGDWCVVSDPDEWFCEEFCKDVRKLIEEAETKGVGLLLINSHDVTVQPDGTKSETISDFFKNLIFSYEEGIRYEGVGEVKEVHETLRLPPGTKQATLPRKYYYEHVKYWHEIWERAARNVFIAGGGNNVGERNPSWRPLRQICDSLGLDLWPKAREYFRKGNIDPRLKKWLWDNRYEGWDFEHEEMEFGRWYFEYLHPEEAEGWKPVFELKPGSPQEVMRYVEEQYLSILGRHADDPGKKFYTKAILEGTIKREQLPAILKGSLEFQERFGKLPAEEKVRIPVPVDVDVRITEGLFEKALLKSQTYWQKIKPKLDFAKKWDALLNIARKAETGGRGVDKTRKEAFVPFVETFAEYAPPEKFQFILDVGAGCGSESSALMGKGYKVIGITFGEDNIKYAKEHFGIDLLEMDMHNLQFPDGYFDGAFMIQTFEHAFSPWLFIIELRRVLRDGGRVFLDVPDPDDEEMLKTIWHTSVLYPNQIKALFWKAGFKEVVDLSQKHRLAFLFEKIPDGEFKMWGYVKHIFTQNRKYILSR